MYCTCAYTNLINFEECGTVIMSLVQCKKGKIKRAITGEIMHVYSIHQYAINMQSPPSTPPPTPTESP